MFSDDQDMIFGNLDLYDAEVQVTEVEADENTPIEEFDLRKETIETLKRSGFTHLFPIQKSTIKPIMQGHDLIAKDRTGSGKTLAFALSVLERLRNEGLINKRRYKANPLVMVMVPTRELARQVANEFEKLKNDPNEFSTVCLYGGSSMNEQRFALRRGVEVVVGTPGRIMDMHERGWLNYGNMRTFVLDETDQMLDIGFQKAIEETIQSIKVATMEERSTTDVQIMLFSATVPQWVQSAAKRYLKSDHKFINNVKDMGVRTSTTVNHFSMHVKNDHMKMNLIKDLFLKYVGPEGRCIVFTSTKLDADRITERLGDSISCRELHGDIVQEKRDRTLQQFREGRVQCLVATDVAARGLDISNVDLVIQLEPPKHPDSYIHRSGRTGRAGKRGTCVTFYNNSELANMAKIESAANITFQQVGPPQPEELIKIKIENTQLKINKTNPEKLGRIDEVSKELVSTYGAKEVIQRLLHNLHDIGDLIVPKSLLTTAKGFVAYVVEMPLERNTFANTTDMVLDGLNDEFKQAVGEIQMLNNQKGFVIDIRYDLAERIIEDIKENFQCNIYKAKELPIVQSFISKGHSKSHGRSRMDNHSHTARPRRNHLQDDSQPTESRLHLRNLPKTVKYQDIRDLFAKYDIECGYIFLQNKSMHHDNGMAYVQLKNIEDANTAIEQLNGELMQDKTIEVKFDKDKQRIRDDNGWDI